MTYGKKKRSYRQGRGVRSAVGCSEEHCTRGAVHREDDVADVGEQVGEDDGAGGGGGDLRKGWGVREIEVERERERCREREKESESNIIREWGF